MRKSIAVMLVCFLLFGVQTSLSSKQSPDSTVIDPAEQVTTEKTNFTQEEERFFKAQAQSNEAYQKLIAFFAEETGTGLMEGFPAYYSGAKINSDGSLTIRVNNASEQEKQTILDICNAADVVFEEADYSLSHLIEIKDNIREILEEYKEQGKIASFCLSVYDSVGQIKVEINSDQINEIQTTIQQHISILWPEDEDRIVFASGDGPVGL